MPAAGDVRAGGAYVELGAEDRDLDRILLRARDKVKKFADGVGRLGRRLVVAGTIAVAPIALSIRKFSAYGDQVAKMARRTGFSTEAVSRLGHAAQISGTSIEALEVGLKRMSRTIFDATLGLAESKRAFEQLGISLDDIKAKSPEQQFMMIADAIGRIEDPTKKAALAQIVMGRSGTMLIPLLNAGAKGIARLGIEAEMLGVVLGEKTAGEAEELTDAITRMRTAFKGIQLQIAQALLPLVMDWLDSIQDSSVAIIKWIKLHKEGVVAIAKMAVALLGVGVALITVSGLMKAFAMFFTPAGAIAMAVAAVIILAEAFGLMDVGLSKLVGSIDVAGTSLQVWFQAVALELFKMYENISNVAVKLVTLWGPVMEQLKSMWRDMGNAMAKAFLFVIEKVLDGLDWLPQMAKRTYAKFKEALGLISEEEYARIVEKIGRETLFPGTRQWIDETRAGLRVLGMESDAALTAAWRARRTFIERSAAETRKKIDEINEAENDLFNEEDKRNRKRKAERDAARKEQAERIKELQKQLDALGADIPKIPGLDDTDKPAAISAAARGVLGTALGWRAAGVAAGGQREVVEHLRNIDKATTKTSVQIINMTGRYGGG